MYIDKLFIFTNDLPECSNLMYHLSQDIFFLLEKIKIKSVADVTKSGTALYVKILMLQIEHEIQFDPPMMSIYQKC